MVEHVLHPTRTARGRLLARRRAEIVVVQLLTWSGGCPSADAVVRTVKTCSRELSEAGVDHGSVDVLRSTAGPGCSRTVPLPSRVWWRVSGIAVVAGVTT